MQPNYSMHVFAGRINNTEKRAESRNQSWLAFARAEPVAADWIAQDLGATAPDLLDPATAPAALGRLAEADEIEPSDGFWKAWIHVRDARRAGRLGDATSRWGP